MIIIGIFGYIGFDNFYARAMEDDAIKELIINVKEISASKQGEAVYVACLGSIENKTSFKFKEAKFEVNFYSGSGELIDTFSVKDKEIYILPNNITNFRVRGIAQKEGDTYKECKVKVVDAWAI